MAKELSIISNAIEADDPPFFVAYVHGPGGIGKSRLIHAAINRINPEINRYLMDCRQIEPTPQGFQIALGSALEIQISEPDFETVVNCLAEQNHRAVLALDIKRTYMELRPSLRRIYYPIIDLATFEPILFPLGFRALEKNRVSLGETTYHTLMNDFGPSSIDGWLAKIIGQELKGIPGKWQLFAAEP
jgi:hypothetical protein